ncbi:MAG: hypothetical protein RR246_01570, partial [Clostridia bacterium]
TQHARIDEFVDAPIKKGDIIGEIEYFIDDKKVDTSPVFVSEDIPEMTFFRLWKKILKKII